VARDTLKRSLQTLAGTLGTAVEQVGSGVESVGTEMKQPERFVRAAQVLLRTGILKPERSDTALKAAKTLFDWKMTPAAAFVVSRLRYPDEPAIIDERGQVTFGEVDKRTNALAHALTDAGITPDDGVAIMCRDHRWFIEATVALSKLGATALFYNTSFAGPQLTEVTEREDPRAIIYDEEFQELIDEGAGERKRWIAWHEDDETGDDSVEKLIEKGDESDVPAPDKPGKITLLTSGSTGTPKGASRSQPDAIEPIVAVLGRIPMKAREHTFFAAPLFHAWGFLQFNMGLILSSTYVLRRRFDPEATLASIEENKCSALVIVPIMLQRILELDEETREKYDLSSLRVVAASGGPMPGELSEKWMDTFGDNLYNLYGSTEVAWATIATPEDMRAAPGTSGPAPPGTSLKILDEESREEVEPGETGAIYVGNRMLFEGYTGGGSEEMVDGHMETGDLGHLDEEGRLFVEGRSDDMIVSGGENVFPEEVEETLEKHEGVSEAAVIGVDDEEFGERLKAFVVKEGEVSEDDLKSHVKETLAKFKVPREIEFVDELPRKPQGKVDKQKLEEEQEEEGDAHGDSDGEASGADN
jgi:acyl-CoA synthetase (AMP-forming)/AMP-acid ligase II